ncbi:MAG TPA: 2-C-methyl-D-erythritol 4-phosphate cytidylyltransferase [Candidatus Kapabacteria bacterium]|nr:2-C-methyl-D-erythritol 4-phosphate cytidylyltransferase [Candidatus Kapabacteria bacterium]
MKNLALILAGGSGKRIDGVVPKQFLLLDGQTILQHSIDKFENHPCIDQIFIVIHGDFLDRTKEIVRGSGYRKVVKILKGGETRQDSSRIGVTAANPGEYQNVLIHDAARPFVSKTIIDNTLAALETHSAVNVAIPSSDTIIEINHDHYIKSVPDRTYLRRVQTPQAFKLDLIQKAHCLALENNITNATDDCSLILKLDLAPIYVVEGSERNIKITYPLDLQFAQNILALETKDR